MLGNIEAFHLLTLRYPDGDENTDQLQQRVGDAGRPDEGDPDPVELDQQQMRIALDQAGGPADRGGREHPGQQNSGHAADAVNAEHIERIAIFETALQPGAGPETHQAGDHADDDAMPGGDKSGSRRDGAEPGHRPRNHAEHRRLAPVSYTHLTLPTIYSV